MPPGMDREALLAEKAQLERELGLWQEKQQLESELAAAQGQGGGRSLLGAVKDGAGAAVSGLQQLFPYMPGAGAVTGISDSANEAIDAMPGVKGLLGKALQGPTMGWADEIGAAMHSGAIPALGIGDEGAFNEALERYKAPVRQAETEMPIMAGITEGASSLATPVPGLGALNKVGQAGGTVSRLMRAFTSGAGQAGLTAAGKDESGDRLMQGLEGAAVGGLSGAAFGEAFRAAPAVGRYMFGKRAPKMDAAELEVLKQTKYVPVESLDRGVNELSEAYADNIPMTVWEAMPDSTLKNFAFSIANDPTTSHLATEALTERAKSVPARISGYLDDVVEGGSRISNARALQGAARDRIGQEQKSLEDIGEGVYKWAGAEQPKIPGRALEKLTDAMQNPEVGRSFKEIAGRTQYANLPGDSTKLWHAVKSDMGAKLDLEQNANIKRLMTEDFNTLRSGLREGGNAYLLADDLYSAQKGLIDELKSGPIGTIANDKAKAITVARELLNMDPEDLRALKGGLGKERYADLRRGVKAAIEDKVAKTREGNQTLPDVFRTPLGRERLEVILGKEDAGKLIKRLEREFSMHQGKVTATGNSQTAARLAATPILKRGLTSAVSTLGGYFGAPAKEVLLRALASTAEDEAMQTFAKRMYSMGPGGPGWANNYEGLDSLMKVIEYRKVMDPLIKKQREAARAGTALGSVAGAQYGSRKERP